MSRLKIRSTFVICVILFGIGTNVIYAMDLLKGFFDPQFNNATREILISAVALEFGWAALLLWALFKPREKRLVLLMTAIPMAIGNLLHSINQSIFADAEPFVVMLNLAIGGAVVGLFVLAFFFSPQSHSSWRSKARAASHRGA